MITQCKENFGKSLSDNLVLVPEVGLKKKNFLLGLNMTEEFSDTLQNNFKAARPTGHYQGLLTLCGKINER